MKPGETYRDKFSLRLARVGAELGFEPERRLVVYRGAESFSTQSCRVASLKEYLVGDGGMRL